MDKNQPSKEHQPIDILKEKKEKNAGSGGFNQGAEQEPDMNDGVADGTPNPDKVSKEPQNPKKV